MLELDDKDIELLFKKIVLLDDGAATPTKSKESKTVETIPAEQTEEATTTHEETEAEPIPEAPSNPFADYVVGVVSTRTVKESLHLENSNWSKIISALGLTALKESHISIEELDSTEQLSHCKAVWCIGLTREQEAPFTALKTALLFSPNPETLTTVEEKRSMFEPLKQFAPNLKA